MNRKPMTSRFWLLLPVLVISACVELTPTPQEVEPVDVIRWDRSPETIVFRGEITGGNTPTILTMNEVPRCTIYGDNRVVWVNELGAFQTEVLYDMVSDEAIADFVNYLTVEERVYTYAARADLQVPQNIPPVVERVTLNVNDEPYIADAFSGWDVEWFNRVITRCKEISSAPILFDPQTAWIRSEAVDAPSANIIMWNAEASGLSLAELANSQELRWIEGDNVRILWNFLHTLPPSLVFGEGDRYFRVGMQIPQISANTPPAPTE